MFCKLIPKRRKKKWWILLFPPVARERKGKPVIRTLTSPSPGATWFFFQQHKSAPHHFAAGLPLFFRAYVIAGSKRCSMCQRRRCQPGWHFRVFRGPVAAAAEIFYKQENHSTNIFSRHGSNVHHRAAAAAGQRALFISWRGGIKKEEGGKIKHLKRPRRK